MRMELSEVLLLSRIAGLKIAYHNVVIMGHMVSCFSCIIHEVLHYENGNVPIRVWASAKNQTTGEFMKI